MDFWDTYIADQKVHSESGQIAQKQPCHVQGAQCPNCDSGVLEYNGKLEIVCPLCGFVITAGFT